MILYDIPIVLNTFIKDSASATNEPFRGDLAVPSDSLDRPASQIAINSITEPEAPLSKTAVVNPDQSASAAIESFNPNRRASFRAADVALSPAHSVVRPVTKPSTENLEDSVIQSTAVDSANNSTSPLNGAPTTSTIRLSPTAEASAIVPDRTASPTVNSSPADPIPSSQLAEPISVVIPDYSETMTANIPAKLKAADLTRFIVRAAQLESAKPVIAYWCEYWIVNQILSKGLQNGDNETMAYTMTLMDKLETVKADNATNDAIMDDIAGQAYVGQFALETFQRADRTVQADKVTKQTADTFSAAATFFELINIWGAPDAETQAKIKYAKWNAVRIAKALKEGKNPNESNPKPETQPEEEILPDLDPNDPEVQGLEGPVKSRQASVEEVIDEQDGVEKKLAPQSFIDQSLHPSAQASARSSPAAFDPYPRDGFPYTVAQDENVSPPEPSPSPPPPDDRNDSVGGGYFPEVPTFTSESSEVPHPTAHPGDMLDLGLPQQPSFNPTKGPKDFESFPPPALDDPPTVTPQEFYAGQGSEWSAPPSNASPNEHYAPPRQPRRIQPPPPPPQYHSYPPPPQSKAPPVQRHQIQPPPPPPQYKMNPTPLRKEQLNTDDVAIAKAQKHARWAISALNFEDAETAVKELRDALKTLGAS